MVKKENKITAWSHSRLNTYEQCPLKAKLQCIDKIFDPETPAPMKRGAEIHKKAEKYLKGRIRNLPKELKDFNKEFKALKKNKDLRLMLECEWAYTKNWSPCSWFGSEAWVRMKLDLAYITEPKNGVHMKVIDYKTGRSQADPEQLELYVIGAFLKFPDLDSVTPEFWYIDQDEIVQGDTFERKDLKKLQAKWKKKVKPLLADRTFAPRPSDKCRWCYYRKDEHGDCKY